MPGSFLEFVAAFTGEFEKEGFTYAISGAMANVVWGIPRTTRDVDLIVSVLSIQIPKMLQILADHGCDVDMNKAIEGLRSSYFTSVSHKLGDVEIFVPAVPFHNTILKRRVKKEIDGNQMWFVSAEDLIILKMIFHRTKDIADIKAIISVQGQKLDRDYIEETVQKIFPAGDSRVKELEELLG